MHQFRANTKPEMFGHLTLRRCGRTVTEWISCVAHEASTQWDVVHHLTFGVLSTCSRTRVLTLIADTSAVRWAIGIQQAFWTTSLIWITEIFGKTRAGTGSILFPTYRIRSTWTGRTRLLGTFHRIVLLWLNALREWITSIARSTNAYGSVIHCPTLGVMATGIGARILTFLSNTRQVIGTLRVTNAFGSTIWRCTNETGQTRTRWRIANCPAFCIRSARRRVTWVSRILLHWHLNYLLTPHERIASVSRWAAANWIVVDDSAFGTNTTSSRARISALLIDASLILGTIRIQDTLRSTIRGATNESG